MEKASILEFNTDLISPKPRLPSITLELLDMVDDQYPK